MGSSPMFDAVSGRHDSPPRRSGTGCWVVLVDQAGQVVPRSFQTNQSPLPLCAPGWYGLL